MPVAEAFRRAVSSSRALPLLLGLALPSPIAPSACASYGPPAATTVARGAYFSTGNPDYDDFFLRLFRLQVALGSAPEALARARGSLSLELGLTEKADATQVRSALVTRGNELRARGVSIRLENDREAPGGSKLKVSGAKEAADTKLVGALESAFALANRQRAELPGWRKELEALPPRGVALESGLDAAFVGTGRGTRSDIRANLADAQKIMGLMGPRLKEVDESSAELAAAIAQAFPAPAPPPPPEPPPPEPEQKAKPRRQPSAGRAPNGAKPTARPATPSEASEAAPPKPAPGTAKPDFEP